MKRESIYKNYKIENKPLFDTDDASYYFIFNNDKLFITKNNEIPFLDNINKLNLNILRKIYLGRFNNSPVFTLEINDSKILDYKLRGLREFYKLVDEDVYLLASRAIQLINWDKNHSYCGRCGTKTETKEDEMAKVCPNCGFMSFTRLSPAIIVAITKNDNELLMANHTRSPKDKYSLIAGFVEAGETIEEAVHREVFEEVGLKIKNIKYMASQSWPFPHSLMLGFIAEYESGEINIDDFEIRDAKWFKKEDIEPLESNISIASSLINYFKNKYYENKS